MAEIPVEKKSSMGWLWLLLLLLLAAVLLWWFLAEDDDAEMDDSDAVVAEQTIEQDGMDGASVDDMTAGEMTIANIVANPSAYFDEEGFTGDVDVAGPLTDRGFWIESDGARMFAIVVDEPAERRIDINPGATLRLDGGTIREASTISATDIDGDALDQDTVNVIAGEEAVLVIDEDNMEIVDDA